MKMKAETKEAWKNWAYRNHFDYTSGFWKVVDLVAALLLGILVTSWWRKPPDMPTEIFLWAGGPILFLMVGVNYMQVKLSAKSRKEFNGLVKSVSQNQHDLTRLLNTMPPAYAMDVFTESYMDALRLRRSIPSDPPDTIFELKRHLSDLTKGVHICLDALARLYVQYEHKPLATACFAHWLQFWSMDDFKDDPEMMQRVLDHLDFVDNPDDPLYGLAGVLHVDPEMTAEVNQERKAEPQNDSNAKELFLPVPAHRPSDDGTSRKRFLPVGPLAFDEGAINYSNVKEQITESTMRQWNVSPEVVDKVLQYFHEEQAIGSIIGYRLVYKDLTSEKPEDGFPLGVLVIFTKTADSKDGDGVISSYFTLCRPLLELQKDLIFDLIIGRDKLMKIKAAEAKASREK